MNPQAQNKSVLGRGLGSLLSGANIQAPATNDSHAAAQVEAKNISLNTQSLANSHNGAVASSTSTQVAAGAQTAGVQAAVATTAQSKDRHMGISVLAVDDILPNPNQPRKDFDPALLAELSNSIKENGLIQPLVVRRIEKGYELIAGERRLRASKLAGLKVVPVVIRKSTDRESLELAIVENIQRENLNCVDEALAYFRLMNEYQLTQDELSRKMGKERSTIANSIRVLKLSEPILVKLKKGELSQGHAKALLAVEDFQKRERLSHQISNLGLNVRQAEKMAQSLREKKEASAGTVGAETSQDAALHIEHAEKLKKLLRTRVAIHSSGQANGKGGKIEISFGGRDELNRIMNLLLGADA